MLLLNDITQFINGKVSEIVPGAKVYGVAKMAVKDGQIMPYIDEKYIGIDDTYTAMSYHKQLTVASTTVPRTGYGDGDLSLQNTYQMAMVIYLNENKTGFVPDQLYTFIQSAITGVLKAESYKSIRVGVSSAILNDAQVWAQEYGQSPYKLSGPQRLMQINYSIVIVFDQNCITLPNCKN